MKLHRFVRNRRAALTLVELLVVVALLLLLASLGLSTLRGLLKGQKVAQAAATLKQYLQNAQMRAVASGRPVAVFFDRVSLDGNGVLPGGAPLEIPIPQNFTSTRIQVGEVFPPYSGDFEDAVGLLVDLDSDKHADGIQFSPGVLNSVDNVSAGLGVVSGSNLVRGFVREGDNIEIDGFDARFVIDSVFIPAAGAPAGTIRVLFSNASIPPQIPLPDSAASYRRFRIYRQPTKSLVGAVALPRGTCVDFALSGVGIGDSSVEAGTFALTAAPSLGSTPSSSDFSRIAIVFDGDGRVASIIEENTLRTVRRVFPPNFSGMIYLLVGRTERVLPGFCYDNSSILKISLSTKLASLQHPDFGDSELPPSNLLDAESIWLTCSPLTGEIRTSPVKELDLTTVTARYGQVVTQLQAGSPTNVSIQDLIMDSRSLAAAGLSNK